MQTLSTSDFRANSWLGSGSPGKLIKVSVLRQCRKVGCSGSVTGVTEGCAACSLTPSLPRCFLGANSSTYSGQALGATQHDTALLGRPGRGPTLGRELEDGDEPLQSDF